MKNVLTLLLLTLVWGLSAQETHTVQANQTLYSLAKLYNVPVDQLKAWNNLESASLRVGQVLVVKPAPANTVVNPGLNPFLYTVRNGDSLSALSLKFDISVELLRTINGMGPSQNLFTGQRLYIRRPIGVVFYTVSAGDTLSFLSALFDISQKDLRGVNQLASDSLVPGKALRVFKPAEVPLNHEVAVIDTLPGIAALYNTTVANLQTLNPGLADLHKGQVLKLRTYASATANTVFEPAAKAPVTGPTVLTAVQATYTVKAGDTLMGISRNTGISLDKLMSYNSLDGTSIIRVGMSLVLGAPKAVSFPEDVKTPEPKASAFAPSNLPDFQDADESSLKWDSYVVMDRAIPVFEWNNDYYYWTHPGELSQPNRGYYENSWPSPLDAYKKARQLYDKFGSLIEEKLPLSGILSGYTVVLDPGHGGVDPGAIVKSTDANGKEVWITEHEYVYDIALRMYALLKRHGARVEMTVLAPNHLVRETKPANNTLINEKNQVYNDLALNASDDSQTWPNGSAAGLEKRIQIADKAFSGVAAGKRIFVSLHADNNPSSPLGTGVYALETTGGGIDNRSKAFADKLVPYLGANAYARTQNLGVLRGNDADFKVLVEVHNLASEEQSFAMRSGNSRQLSAQKLVRGLLEYFKK
ncbi:MAG: LysM peptidoglycan-binding domain-containing protein [Spirochaetales bacterium]